MTAMMRARVFAGLALFVGAASCVRAMTEPQGCVTNADCVDGMTCQHEPGHDECYSFGGCVCRDALYCTKDSDCTGGHLCYAATSTCTARDALPANCGDGQFGASEGCDDGNTAGGDGCSATCQPEAGYRCHGSPTVCAQALLYAASYGYGGGVFQLGVRSDGTLAQLAPPALAGVFIDGLATTRDARFLYAANAEEKSIFQLAIQPDGTLAPLSPSALTFTDAAPSWIGIDSSGRFAYAIDQVLGQVLRLAIAQDGHLTRLDSPLIVPATAPRFGGNFSLTGLANPAAPRLYLGDRLCGGACFLPYAIDDTGLLAALPALSLGGYPDLLTMDPAGHALFATLSDLKLNRYAITDGGVGPALASLQLQQTANDLVVHPSGSTLYQASRSGKAVFQYGIAGDRSLAPLTPASVRAESGLTRLAIDPDGRYLYARSDSDAISQFAIGDGGALTSLGPASVRLSGSSAPMVLVRPR